MLRRIVKGKGGLTPQAGGRVLGAQRAEEDCALGSPQEPRSCSPVSTPSPEHRRALTGLSGRPGFPPPPDQRALAASSLRSRSSPREDGIERLDESKLRRVDRAPMGSDLFKRATRGDAQDRESVGPPRAKKRSFRAPKVAGANFHGGLRAAKEPAPKPNNQRLPFGRRRVTGQRRRRPCESAP